MSQQVDAEKASERLNACPTKTKMPIGVAQDSDYARFKRLWRPF
jgi:hypothetical protein